MYRTLVFAALLLAVNRDSRAQWSLQESHTKADLQSVHFLSGGIVWAAGSNGTVVHTENAGSMWRNCAVPQGAEHLAFTGIQAIEDGTVFVLSSGKGDLSRVYESTDACQTWKLILTNPDKEGEFKGLRFGFDFSSALRPHQVQRPGIGEPIGDPSLRGHLYGVIIGSPVNGNFVIYQTFDSGETWKRWRDDDAQAAAVASKSEFILGTGNSAIAALGVEGPFAFVTGGPSGSRLFIARRGANGGLFWDFKILHLPSSGTATSGYCSVATRAHRNDFYNDFMIVGGDSHKPEERRKTALFARTNEKPVEIRSVVPTSPPHGYRSAVAYNSAAKAWICVGPNGTDLTLNDGKSRRALKPVVNDAPHADQNWNAISFPFVVGPNGRIGQFNSQLF